MHLADQPLHLFKESRSAFPPGSVIQAYELAGRAVLQVSSERNALVDPPFSE